MIYKGIRKASILCSHVMCSGFSISFTFAFDFLAFLIGSRSQDQTRDDNATLTKVGLGDSICPHGFPAPTQKGSEGTSFGARIRKAEMKVKTLHEVMH